LESPQNAAHERSLLSEEQEETADGRKDTFRHLLSALQFPKERQNIFFNRRSAGIHRVSHESIQD
jgi:hypothetical protein